MLRKGACFPGAVAITLKGTENYRTCSFVSVSLKKAKNKTK